MIFGDFFENFEGLLENILSFRNLTVFAGVILVLLNLTYTLKDSCEPKCPFCPLKFTNCHFLVFIPKNTGKSVNFKAYVKHLHNLSIDLHLCVVSAQLLHDEVSYKLSEIWENSGKYWFS